MENLTPKQLMAAGYAKQNDQEKQTEVPTVDRAESLLEEVTRIMNELSQLNEK